MQSFRAKAVKVGILSGNQSQLGMRQRLKSVKDKLEEAGIEISWILSEKELDKKMRNVEYFAEQPVDTVILLIMMIRKKRWILF